VGVSKFLYLSKFNFLPSCKIERETKESKSLFIYPVSKKTLLHQIDWRIFLCVSIESYYDFLSLCKKIIKN